MSKKKKIALALAAIAAIALIAHRATVNTRAQTQSTGTAGYEYATSWAWREADASQQQISSPDVNPRYYKQAEIYVTWGPVYGSPAGCGIQIAASGDGSNFINAGPAMQTPPGTNEVGITQNPLGIDTILTYTCTTYPTAPTKITVETVYK